MKTIRYLIPIKVISTICACLLFAAVFNLPIEYYTILRIVVFIGSLLIIDALVRKNIWVLVFGVIAILFNPIIPMYLYIKSYWIPIDIASGILFLLVLFFDKPKRETKKIEKKRREFSRDKIY
ncbi:DUF6804 family protein [Aquimarina sp. MMG016]|uniref:DUF6804 family protein n=1 Tax=Aquimarina sp. MMG016 TaxID=2822690 RepID=UPI001B3A0360|nr:DUF6804 family protein [Aquimarina sp. MMG016]MBQ4819614.1 hypothetical protein [Aquimarina sp. MMG016]